MTNQKEYMPAFKNPHDFLMEMYRNVMLNPNEEESKIWGERLKGVLEGWRTLRMQGIFPEYFTKTFYVDIRHVMGIIQTEVNQKGVELAEHQKLFTFNMATLQSEFGAKL